MKIVYVLSCGIVTSNNDVTDICKDSSRQDSGESRRVKQVSSEWCQMKPTDRMTWLHLALGNCLSPYYYFNQ
ncbi:hypothetical protein LguiB_034707 [Lonicera macranthoides]